MEEIVEEKDAAYRNGDRESMRREKREKRGREKQECSGGGEELTVMETIEKRRKG